ncbi:MAG: hypothetical protein K940chlam7_01216 [Chlamydiae bacterium]|nr:hypothetical protein [Chlamydiota bacterium]
MGLFEADAVCMAVLKKPIARLTPNGVPAIKQLGLSRAIGFFLLVAEQMASTLVLL